MEQPCAKRPKLQPADRTSVVLRCVLFVARLKVRRKRKRSLGEVLADIGMVQEPLRIRDIRYEAKELTMNKCFCVMPSSLDMHPKAEENIRCGTCAYKGITVKDRLENMVKSWSKRVVAVRTTTGLAFLHDNPYPTYHPEVIRLRNFLRQHKLDVEYIPPRYYTREDSQDQSEKNLCTLKFRNSKWRGLIAGIRLLNEEGRKQRQLKRTKAFAAELMARCWRPDGPLIKHVASGFVL